MLGSDHLLGVGALAVAGAPVLLATRRRSISATVFGVITTPRQPRLESSSTAQMSDSAGVSPGKRPITLVRRRTSTNVRSSRLVVRIRAVLRRPAQVCDGRVEIAF